MYVCYDHSRSVAIEEKTDDSVLVCCLKSLRLVCVVCLRFVLFRDFRLRARNK